ncbi:cytochrome P450 [Mycobacterium sp. IDR2000157661]|uniref:cytochrome P450 n=1 Tax=Mycobacterium sp. IDR2000157661 TaxID=2867005 RepID=UPI00351D27B4|nr:cytochrome P450 [Mycobacterium sp. IDR2000157661]
MAEATTDPVRLPPGPRLPKAAVGLAFLTARHRTLVAIGRRYGAAFTVDLPMLGRSLIVSDRVLVKDLFTTNSDLVVEPGAFDPDRFIGAAPDTHAWIPYGGGIRRCIGAAFANMEMTATLRTLLRGFEFGATSAPGERRRSRGVATAPARGGRAVVYRRATTSTDADAHHLTLKEPV